MSDKTKTVRSTFVVMVCTFASRILGFIRIAVITAIFGAGDVADVINLTFSIPNNLRKLMAEGALSSAFIPVLSQAIVKDKSGKEPKRLVRNILSFQVLILVPLCVLLIIFAKPLISLVLAEFDAQWQVELAVKLFRWFINYLLFISISAVLMATLNSSGHFIVPAVTPILFSICVIGSIILLHDVLGVYSMVVGVLAGGLAQILFQSPVFIKSGFDFKPDFKFKNSGFQRIMKQWMPVLATSSILTVTQTIAFRFASGLSEGSTSALSNAVVFWQFPYGIFSASISTVLFPRMSRQAASSDYSGLADTIQYGIRYLAVLLIPSTLFLSLFGKEIIAVTIQHGMFTAENTIMTASVLTAYSAGLFSSGAYNFLQRFFYSSGNYRIPLYMTIIIAVSDIILSLILKETYLGVRGLAYANTISFSIGFIILFILAVLKLQTIDYRSILKTFLKIIFSMTPFIAFLLIFKRLSGDWWLDGSSFYGVAMLLAGFTVSCALILGMYKLTRVEMINDLLSKRKRKNA